MKRLGVVSYINTLPLTYSLTGYDIVPGSPSELGDMYAQGLLDAAILPVYEVFLRSGDYIVDDVSISSPSDAGSVLCFLNKPIEELGLVGVDSSSRTSTQLLRLLLKEYYGLKCQIETVDPDNLVRNRDRFDAYLLIGDRAIQHRKVESSFIDPAGVWRHWTGLPFVFALWVSKEKDIILKNHLLDSKRAGLAHIEDIIEGISLADRDFLAKYYGVNLSYDLGKAEKESLKLYQQKLYEAGLLPGTDLLSYY